MAENIGEYRAAMKVLVTGSTGMVGKNLLEHPKASEFEILAPSSIELNLLDSLQTRNYLNEQRPTLIVHCAGIVGGIQANIRHPFMFLADNAQMGLNLIVAAKETGVKMLLNLGSSCMYPRDYKTPLKEEYILKADLEPTNEGYALAKILCAKLCEYVNREVRGAQYKTLIPCNLFGRWDTFDPDNSHMISAVIRKLHEARESGQESVEVWGDGKARREFMYAADLADFMYIAMQNLDDLPQNSNVGMGADYSINEYYEVIKSVVGYAGTFHHNLDKPAGMKQKLMDSSQARASGWRPRHTLREGIEKSYDFFKKEVLK